MYLNTVYQCSIGGDANCNLSVWSAALEDVPEYKLTFEEAQMVWGKERKNGDLLVAAGIAGFDMLEEICDVRNRDPQHNCLMLSWCYTSRPPWREPPLRWRRRRTGCRPCQPCVGAGIRQLGTDNGNVNGNVIHVISYGSFGLFQRVDLKTSAKRLQNRVGPSVEPVLARRPSKINTMHKCSCLIWGRTN